MTPVESTSVFTVLNVRVTLLISRLKLAGDVIVTTGGVAAALTADDALATVAVMVVETPSIVTTLPTLAAGHARSSHGRRTVIEMVGLRHFAGLISTNHRGRVVYSIHGDDHFRRIASVLPVGGEVDDGRSHAVPKGRWLSP